MADKEIEIRLKQSGAEQAAAAVKQASDATTALGQAHAAAAASAQAATTAQNANSEAASQVAAKHGEAAKSTTEASSANDKNAESLDKAAQAVKINTEAQTENAKAMDSAAASAEKVAEKTKEAASAMGSKAFQEYGKAITDIGSALIDAGKDLSETNSKFGDQVTDMGRVTQAAGQTVTAMAAGFEAGGPIGAAVAGLTQVVTTYAKAWLDTKVAEEKAQEAMVKGMSDIRENSREARIARGEILEQKLADKFRDEADAISEYNDKLQTQAQLLQARHKADADIKKSEIELQIAQIRGNSKLSETERTKQIGAKEQELNSLDARTRMTSVDDRVNGLKTLLDAAKNEENSQRVRVHLTTNEAEVLDHNTSVSTEGMSARELSDHENDIGKLKKARDEKGKAEAALAEKVKQTQAIQAQYDAALAQGKIEKEAISKISSNRGQQQALGVQRALDDINHRSGAGGKQQPQTARNSQRQTDRHPAGLEDIGGHAAGILHQTAQAHTGSGRNSSGLDAKTIAQLEKMAASVQQSPTQDHLDKAASYISEIAQHLTGRNNTLEKKVESMAAQLKSVADEVRKNH